MEGWKEKHVGEWELEGKGIGKGIEKAVAPVMHWCTWGVGDLVGRRSVDVVAGAL